MQRVLSGERARCIETSEEFVTKKLCLSVIIICAFFSMLGGFFLGQYATEKAAASKKARMEHKFQLEMLNQLSISINRINNLTTSLSVLPASTLASFNYSELYGKLRCSEHRIAYPDSEKLNSDVKVESREIIMTDLNFLQRCYGNVSSFLETVLFPD